MKLLRLLAFLLISTYVGFAANEPLSVHPDKTPAKAVFQEANHSKFATDKMLATELGILDSMANCFAYFGPNNAFMYEPVTKSLVYIRRGYVDMLKEPFYSGTDQKNNLFIRVSTDWGQNWGPTVLAYNEKVEGLDQARYPSVAPYVYQNTLSVAFTAPTVIEKAGGWTGFITGYWNENDGAYNLKTDSTFKYNSLAYKWGLQGILAAYTSGTNEDLNVVAADGVSAVANDLNDASNIGYRFTNDFTKVTSTIPPAWSSSKFIAVTQAGYRANEVVNFHQFNGKLYLGAHGNFSANDVSGRPTMGFSTSTDNGKTWGEFDVFPFSVAKSYASSQGANPDSCAIYYTTKDFTVLDNGDVSFVCLFTEYNGTKKYENNMHHIVEVYKENNAWGVRKIAAIYGSWMVYRDNKDNAGNNTNPNDIELQIARTPDSKHIVAKWVDLIGVRDTVDGSGNPFTTYKTTDIFIASREIGKSVWSTPKNATQSDLKDRTTKIPNYVPNDLQGIPFISTATKINPLYTATNQGMMVDSSTAPQYVLLQLYNYTVDVPESENIPTLNLLGVYPNPASVTSNVDFTTDRDANIEVSIYNLLGQKVQQIYSGFLTSGFHSVNFNINNIQSGTYTCTVTQNGISKSKLINVVR